ncbi:MAG TPA: AbrB/MazE/SpoVT family DNA-binding domain-containing protein [Terracidiphilus sp.]|nr:AbrB/MazE/SpoVT family DNA-binding domain-containing protein [Terracidiphilus sp.]
MGEAIMASASVTSKGQITIPIEIRKKLGVKPGVRLQFIENSAGEIVLTTKTGSLEDLKGIVKWKGKPASIKAMNRVIRKGWAGQLKLDD